MNLHPPTQRLRRAWLEALCLAAAALLLVACGVSARPHQEGNVIRFVRNPDAAPDFTLDALDGKPLSLAGSRGKVVLLNFWATWCAPAAPKFPT